MEKLCGYCGEMKDERYFPEKGAYCVYCTRIAPYRITRHQFDDLLASQNEGCAICGTIMKSYRELCIDHDHERSTDQVKVVRGILCPACNKGLGLFRDNPDLLRKAANYITTSRNRPPNNEWINAIRFTTDKEA